jgi:hypothetical protein
MSKFKLFKNLFRKKSYVMKEIDNLGFEANEFKLWLVNPTTIVFCKILKILKKHQADSLIENPSENKDHIIGFCQGYMSIIALLERTIATAQNEGEDLTDDELLKITNDNIQELLDLYFINKSKKDYE